MSLNAVQRTLSRVSINTLQRALSSAPQMKIRDAAANYNASTAGKIYELFKCVFTLGLSVAYNKFVNEPAKRESVLNLEKRLAMLRDQKVARPDWPAVRICIQFEGVDYTVLESDNNLFVFPEGMPLEVNQDNEVTNATLIIKGKSMEDLINASLC